MSYRDYCAAGLRLERRPAPHFEVPDLNHFEQEAIHAQVGVQARWIGVVDPEGSPYYPSEHIGYSEKAKPGDKERIRKWVQAIHAAGMTALSWFPMTHSKSASINHPEWRQAFLINEPVFDEASYDKRCEKSWVCINSPYGDALISFTINAIRKFDLDGFYFDGTFFSPPVRPAPVSCICPYCREKFKAQENLDLPGRVDWDDPTFRKWVAWRYRTFTEYIGRLAGEVHRVCPDVRIVANHYHRDTINWLSGMPLNPYPADIVTGSESGYGSPFISAFHTRLMRAYGKPAKEIWMPLPKRGTFSTPSKDATNRLIHHSLACVTAGGMPCFGTDEAPPQTKAVLKKIAGELIPRAVFEGGDSVKYAALHLSQQSETFVFSRPSKKNPEGNPTYYWKTMIGWHHLLSETQLLQDIVFDDNVKPGVLSEYPVVIASLAVALKDEQIHTFEEYVRRGGVLITEPWFGYCDEWGVKADPRRVRGILGRLAIKPPNPHAKPPMKADMTVRSLGMGKVIVVSGNIGERFELLRRRELAEDVSAALKRITSPVVEVEGSPNVHVGLYRKNGELLLHVHNFLAWSEYHKFAGVLRLENPPPPLKNLRVRLRGWRVTSVHSVLNPKAESLKLKTKKDCVEFMIPHLLWGDIFRLEP